MSVWRERDERYLAAHQFPAAMIELADSRGITTDRLLRGTGIFWDDYLSGDLSIKPDQCLQLIHNLRRLLPERDLAFLLGHRMFPGNFGASIHTLWHAGDLAEMIDHLILCQATLSPLLFVRKSVDPDYLYLHWQENTMRTNHFMFLLELSMTALTSLCTHLCRHKVSWEYLIPGPIDAAEQYQVNFGCRVFAHQHTAAMRIPRQLLATPCRFASYSSMVIARNQYLKQQKNQPSVGFIAYIDQCIRNRIPEPLSLQTLADQLALSPATLKRKLKKHGTSFQQRYDFVRKELAIDWLSRQQLSVHEVARRLHFHDSRNLRRAFKRWTGTLPSAIRPPHKLHPL